MAAAEELAKMNMAEITEEKAEQLKATFEELGSRVGSEAGQRHWTLDIIMQCRDLAIIVYTDLLWG